MLDISKLSPSERKELAKAIATDQSLLSEVKVQSKAEREAIKEQRARSESKAIALAATLKATCAAECAKFNAALNSLGYGGPGLNVTLVYNNATGKRAAQGSYTGIYVRFPERGKGVYVDPTGKVDGAATAKTLEADNRLKSDRGRDADGTGESEGESAE